MRPRKKVLLLIPDEIQLSLWRMRLEVKGYAVLAAQNLLDALDLAKRNPDCLLAATNLTGAEGAEGLGSIAMTIKRLLLFGVKSVPSRTLAHRIEFEGDGLPERVLNSVRELAARKRGPLGPTREPRFEMQPTVATLLEERDVGSVAA